MELVRSALWGGLLHEGDVCSNVHLPADIVLVLLGSGLKIAPHVVDSLFVEVAQLDAELTQASIEDLVVPNRKGHRGAHVSSARGEEEELSPATRGRQNKMRTSG